MLKINKFFTFLKKGKIPQVLYWGVVALLGLYSFSIPAFSGRPIYYFISHSFLILLFICSLIYAFSNHLFEIRKRLLLLPMFVFWSFFGTIVFSKNIRAWITLVLLCVSFFVFYYSFISIQKKVLIELTVLLGFAAFAIYFLIVYRNDIFSSIKSGERLGSYFDNENDIGSYMTVASIIGIHLLLHKFKIANLIYIIPLLLFVLVGFLTGSRTFIVTFLVACITAVCIKLKNHKIILAISIVSIIVIFIILINLPFASSMKERFLEVLKTFGIGNALKTDGSTRSRILWQSFGFYLGSQNLFIGYGCYGFAVYSGVGTYTHSTFSEIICDHGIIGALLFYSLLITPIVLSTKNTNKEHNILIIMFFVYYFVKSFLGVFYTSKDTYIVIALMMYLVKDVTILNFKKIQTLAICDYYTEIVL